MDDSFIASLLRLDVAGRKHKSQRSCRIFDIEFALNVPRKTLLSAEINPERLPFEVKSSGQGH
jgi:hypothetical protein